MKISVLMSVYIKTEIDDLRECLQSVFNQTRSPSEVVVVLDGPVSEAVHAELISSKEACEIPINILNFSENRGLGAALSDGLKTCQYDLVARVDSDDVSVPERLEMQYQCFMEYPKLSVVGGALEEIYQTGNRESYLIRAMPLNMDEIIRFSRYRNPVNHPTSMFRRQDVLAVGNYQAMLWFEDYYLWARLIISGYLFKNLDMVLVRARADKAYFQRRGGWQYLKQELYLSAKLNQIGFHNNLQTVRFMTSRFVFRIAPISLRTWLYSWMLRKTRR